MVSSLLTWTIFHLFRNSCSDQKTYLKAVLQNFEKFTGKQLHRNPGCGTTTLLKKRVRHKCFPVNFSKFLGSAFCRIPLGD